MYEHIDFPLRPDRPYFFTNFVATLDGKVDVPSRHADYWPLGSVTDHAELINLRLNSDALIHGRTTAMAHPTVESLGKPEFRAARAARGAGDLAYIVLTDHPSDALKEQLHHEAGIPTFVMSGADLPALARELKARGMHRVLVEGGSHLAGSFFAAGLIDEVFLTMAPKVVGGGGAQTLTMAEGALIPPEQTKGWRLAAAVPVGDELFIRYRRIITTSP